MRLTTNCKYYLSVLFIFFSYCLTTSAVTLQLKPGASAGKDVYLDMPTPNSNYGTHPELPATAWTCNGNPCNARGLLMFDLSSIPAGSIITNARLSLFANTSPGSTGGSAMTGSNQSLLQRVISSWSESTVTWNTTPTTTTTNQVTLAQSSSGFQNYLNINVINIVQDMINDPANSHGFLLRLSNEQPYTSMIFASSDFANSALWPEITIDYNPPLITTLPLPRSTFCLGSPVNVSYTASGLFNNGNIFLAQLSNASGSFASPVNIGFSASIISGTISCTFPSSMSYGSGYRIRVISTNYPVIGSDNGTNISFQNPDDGNLCTTDACVAATGAITHTSVNTNDNNACTNDACDPLTGTVTHNPINTNDNNVCTFDGCDYISGVFHLATNVNDGNSCTTDACDPLTGIVSHTAVNIDDNDVCTVDACDAATGNITHTAVIINDNNACTFDACDRITGAITHVIVNANDNNVCTFDGCDFVTGVFHISTNTDDGNGCTTDACDPLTGIISHSAININDNNSCTADACDLATGNVSHTALIIDDNNACTTDACDPASGAISHTALNTDDSNECTVDGCDFVFGEFHISTYTDDENECTIDGCDPLNGVVFHTAVNINDDDACTIDACNPVTGTVSHTASITDDNNACTSDACDPLTGTISHSVLNADDSNVCTFDGCDFVTGVFHLATNTDDGNECTTDACDPLTGIISHAPINVDDNDLCTSDGCDPVAGVFHDPLNLDDNNLCTTDACDPTTGPSHNPINVDDSNACTFDGCNSFSGPFHNPVNTDDGNACTTDACDPVTGSITHIVLIADDNNACTDDFCDPLTGTITHSAVNANDNNECTTDGCDTGTGVYHNQIDKDDNNGCTIDVCDPVGGVSHISINTDDGNVCTTDACDPASGIISHISVNTDDNNACTSDACDPVTGAISHQAVNTNDNNVCTDDGCDPISGIFHNAVIIDDVNACTMDVCDPVTGVYHFSQNVDDGNICTTDACDPLTGIISHDGINTDDNNACTSDGCDPLTGVYHSTVITDDGNACTIDACDPLTGLVTHTDDTPSLSVFPGIISCYGGTTCITVNASGGLPPYFGTGTLCGYSAGTSELEVIDSRGCITSSSITISQPSKLVLSTTSVSATCLASNGSATALAAGGTPTYSYQWFPSSQTTQTATGLAAGSYFVTVTDFNGCVNSSTVIIASSGTVPNTPGFISGQNGACRGQCGVVYSINPVVGATSYLWTLPNGASGSSTGTSITVCFSNFYNGGYICVKSVNACGVSSSSCFNVPRLTNVPASPGTISGPSSLCPLSTGVYSIALVSNASSYIWSVNGGLSIVSGQGTTSIVVNAPAGYNSGSVKVRASNCRGNSGTRTKNVYGVPDQPSYISGSNFVCKSQTRNYSTGYISGATSYTWTITGGAIILSGNGTPFISVKFTTATSNTASLKVSANNSCGSSLLKTTSINVNLNCKTSDGESSSVRNENQKNEISSFSAYPNPTRGNLTVSFNSTIKSKYVLSVVDLLGNLILTEVIEAVENTNSRDLDLNNLAKGVYILRIQNDNLEIKNQRIVLE